MADQYTLIKNTRRALTLDEIDTDVSAIDRLGRQWSTGATYLRNEGVYYNNRLYFATKRKTTEGVFIPSEWTEYPLVPSGGTQTYKYLDATTAPTVNSDGYNSDGNGFFDIGSLWIDVQRDNAFMCLDNSQYSAVWKKISGSGVTSADTIVASEYWVSGTTETSLTTPLSTGSAEGEFSLALGMGVYALGDYAFILGKTNSGSTYSLIAAGSGNTANGLGAVVLGFDSTANKDRAIMLGTSGFTADSADTAYVNSLRVIGTMARYETSGVTLTDGRQFIHKQYLDQILTNYSPTGHTHDDRYYKKTELPFEYTNTATGATNSTEFDFGVASAHTITINRSSTLSSDPSTYVFTNAVNGDQFRHFVAIPDNTDLVLNFPSQTVISGHDGVSTSGEYISAVLDNINNVSKFWIIQGFKLDGDFETLYGKSWWVQILPAEQQMF